MSSFKKKLNRDWLNKRAKQGMRGYPVGTIAFYGPTDDSATKIAVGIIEGENQDVDRLRRWHSEDDDIRLNTDILSEVVEYLKSEGVKSVAMTDRIVGCPHEEGIDYQGKICPECPFWANRDRWTGEIMK